MFGVIFRSIRRIRCELLLPLTVACLLVKEDYPSSNFPMYSSFGRSTYYVYLTDGADQPLATIATLGITTPTLKKIYDGEVRKEVRRLRSARRLLTVEQRRPAGERVLESLKASPWAQQHAGSLPPVLRLHEVNISISGTRIEKQPQLIAEL